MKAYKVVRTTKDGLKYSAFAGGYQTPSANCKDYTGVIYPHEEFVEASKPYLRLFCFKDVKSALEWAENMFFRDVNTLELWEAEVEGVEEDPNVFFTTPCILDIDHYIRDAVKIRPKRDAPRGTLAVKRIKLETFIKII